MEDIIRALYYSHSLGTGHVGYIIQDNACIAIVPLTTYQPKHTKKPQQEGIQVLFHNTHTPYTYRCR
jgi:hypothetical protein